MNARTAFFGPKKSPQALVPDKNGPKATINVDRADQAARTAPVASLLVVVALSCSDRPLPVPGSINRPASSTKDVHVEMADERADAPLGGDGDKDKSEGVSTIVHREVPCEQN